MPYTDDEYFGTFDVAQEAAKALTGAQALGGGGKQYTFVEPSETQYPPVYQRVPIVRTPFKEKAPEAPAEIQPPQYQVKEPLTGGAISQAAKGVVAGVRGYAAEEIDTLGWLFNKIGEMTGLGQQEVTTRLANYIKPEDLDKDEETLAYTIGQALGYGGAQLAGLYYAFIKPLRLLKIMRTARVKDIPRLLTGAGRRMVKEGVPGGVMATGKVAEEALRKAPKGIIGKMAHGAMETHLVGPTALAMAGGISGGKYGERAAQAEGKDRLGGIVKGAFTNGAIGWSMGMGFGVINAFPMVIRMPATGTLFGGMALAEGADIKRVAADFVTGALMGIMGEKRLVGDRGKRGLQTEAKVGATERQTDMGQVGAETDIPKVGGEKGRLTESDLRTVEKLMKGYDQAQLDEWYRQGGFEEAGITKEEAILENLSGRGSLKGFVGGKVPAPMRKYMQMAEVDINTGAIIWDVDSWKKVYKQKFKNDPVKLTEAFSEMLRATGADQDPVVLQYMRNLLYRATDGRAGQAYILPAYSFRGDHAAGNLQAMWRLFRYYPDMEAPMAAIMEDGSRITLARKSWQRMSKDGTKLIGDQGQELPALKVLSIEGPTGESLWNKPVKSREDIIADMRVSAKAKKRLLAKEQEAMMGTPAMKPSKRVPKDLKPFLKDIDAVKKAVDHRQIQEILDEARKAKEEYEKSKKPAKVVGLETDVQMEGPAEKWPAEPVIKDSTINRVIGLFGKNILKGWQKKYGLSEKQVRQTVAARVLGLETDIAIEGPMEKWPADKVLEGTPEERAMGLWPKGKPGKERLPGEEAGERVREEAGKKREEGAPKVERPEDEELRYRVLRTAGFEDAQADLIAREHSGIVEWIMDKGFTENDLHVNEEGVFTPLSKRALVEFRKLAKGVLEITNGREAAAEALKIKKNLAFREMMDAMDLGYAGARYKRRADGRLSIANMDATEREIYPIAKLFFDGAFKYDIHGDKGAIKSEVRKVAKEYGVSLNDKQLEFAYDQIALQNEAQGINIETGEKLKGRGRPRKFRPEEVESAYNEAVGADDKLLNEFIAAKKLADVIYDRAVRGELPPGTKLDPIKELAAVTHELEQKAMAMGFKMENLEQRTKLANLIKDIEVRKQKFPERASFYDKKIEKIMSQYLQPLRKEVTVAERVAREPYMEHLNAPVRIIDYIGDQKLYKKDQAVKIPELEYGRPKYTYDEAILGETPLTRAAAEAEESSFVRMTPPQKRALAQLITSLDAARSALERVRVATKVENMPVGEKRVIGTFEVGTGPEPGVSDFQRAAWEAQRRRISKYPGQGPVMGFIETSDGVRIPIEPGSLVSEYSLEGTVRGRFLPKEKEGRGATPEELAANQQEAYRQAFEEARMMEDIDHQIEMALQQEVMGVESVDPSMAAMGVTPPGTTQQRLTAQGPPVSLKDIETGRKYTGEALAKQAGQLIKEADAAREAASEDIPKQKNPLPSGRYKVAGAIEGTFTKGFVTLEPWTYIDSKGREKVVPGKYKVLIQQDAITPAEDRAILAKIEKIKAHLKDKRYTKQLNMKHEIGVDEAARKYPWLLTPKYKTRWVRQPIETEIVELRTGKRGRPTQVEREVAYPVREFHEVFQLTDRMVYERDLEILKDKRRGRLISSKKGYHPTIMDGTLSYTEVGQGKGKPKSIQWDFEWNPSEFEPGDPREMQAARLAELVTKSYLKIREVSFGPGTEPVTYNFIETGPPKIKNRTTRIAALQAEVARYEANDGFLANAFKREYASALRKLNKEVERMEYEQKIKKPSEAVVQSLKDIAEVRYEIDEKTGKLKRVEKTLPDAVKRLVSSLEGEVRVIEAREGTDWMHYEPREKAPIEVRGLGEKKTLRRGAIETVGPAVKRPGWDKLSKLQKDILRDTEGITNKKDYNKFIKEMRGVEPEEAVLPVATQDFDVRINKALDKELNKMPEDVRLSVVMLQKAIEESMFQGTISASQATKERIQLLREKGVSAPKVDEFSNARLARITKTLDSQTKAVSYLRDLLMKISDLDTKIADEANTETRRLYELQHVQFDKELAAVVEFVSGRNIPSEGRIAKAKDIIDRYEAAVNDLNRDLKEGDKAIGPRGDIITPKNPDVRNRNERFFNPFAGVEGRFPGEHRFLQKPQPQVATELRQQGATVTQKPLPPPEYMRFKQKIVRERQAWQDSITKWQAKHLAETGKLEVIGDQNYMQDTGQSMDAATQARLAAGEPIERSKMMMPWTELGSDPGNSRITDVRELTGVIERESISKENQLENLIYSPNSLVNRIAGLLEKSGIPQAREALSEHIMRVLPTDNPYMKEALKLWKDFMDGVADFNDMKKLGVYVSNYFPLVRSMENTFQKVKYRFSQFKNYEDLPERYKARMDQDRFGEIQTIFRDKDHWEQPKDQKYPANKVLNAYEREMLRYYVYSGDGIIDQWHKLPSYVQDRMNLNKNKFNQHLQPRSESVDYLAYQWDAIDVLKKYIYDMVQTNYVNNIKKQAAPLVNKWPEPKTWRSVRNYMEAQLRSAFGIRTDLERGIERTIDGINESQRRVVLNPKYVRTVPQFLVKQTARGVLGPDTAARNLTDQLKLLTDKGARAYFGALKYVVENGFTAGEYQWAWDAMHAGKEAFAGDWERLPLAERMKGKGIAKKAYAFYEWLADKALTPLRMTEQFNKSVAFVLAMQEAKARGADFQTAMRLGLKTVSSTVPDLVIPEVYYKAYQQALETQVGYSSPHRAPYLRGPLARISTIFWSYPANLIQWWTKGVRESWHMHDWQRFTRYMLYLGFQATAAAGFGALGYDVASIWGVGVLPVKPMSLPWEALYYTYQGITAPTEADRQDALEHVTGAMGNLWVPQFRYGKKVLNAARNIEQGYRAKGPEELPIMETNPLTEILDMAGLPPIEPRATYQLIRKTTSTIKTDRVEKQKLELEAAKAYEAGELNKVNEILSRAQKKNIPLTFGDIYGTARDRRHMTFLEKRLKSAPKYLRPQLQKQIDQLQKGAFPSKSKQPGRSLWSSQLEDAE